jgi:anti-anti-sigma regulatory factor
MIMGATIDLRPSKEGAVMSITTPAQAHIAYELIDDAEPRVVVIEFLTRDIAGPAHADELGKQLDTLLRSELPQNFVMDFSGVRCLGSTAFGAIVSFARKVGRLHACNIPSTLELGAMLIGLDSWAEVATDRAAAIEGARQTAMLANPEIRLGFRRAAILP